MTAANLLLLAAAGSLVANGLIGLRYARPVTEAFQHAYRDVPEADFSLVSTWFTGAVLLAVAGGLALLALLNQRGSRGARINTWVLGGLVLCWGAGSLPGRHEIPADAPDPAELRRLLAAAIPDWVAPVNTGAIVVTVGAVLAGLILLVLPPSNQYFRVDRRP